MGKLKLRYNASGEVESYDPETGKRVGHVSTMGNLLTRTKEDEEREKKEIVIPKGSSDKKNN